MNSITDSSFSIYRSSAGSGKTYQLALEFVSLAIKDPGLFNKILAVTFTNKATKEMKERILDFLMQLAAGKDCDVFDNVKKSTGLPANEITGNAKNVIGKILHQYSNFSVSTIDAFFQKIVKSFAKELGLLGNFKVELDQDKVKQEIIDQIIDEIGEHKEITNWLVDFSFSKVDENKSWNIRPQIEMLTSEVFKESFRPVSDQMAKIKQEQFKSFLDQIRKIKKQFEEKIKAEAESILNLISSHGLSVDDFSYKNAGPAGYFNKILNGDFEPKSRLKQALENPEKWYTKTSPKKAEIINLVNSGLHDNTLLLLDFYHDQIAGYTTAVEVLKNIYVFGILSQVIQKLKAYRLENDVMLISDVPVFLNRIIAENETPFIYEKTGSWYQHYLIDEFQDTSGYQWQNFKPLVENGLALGHKSLMVGDGKQSIYRWRGGDWNLILNQVTEDLKLFSPVERNLDTNWRSARKIIEFNNATFSFLPSLLSDQLQQIHEKLELSEGDRTALTEKVSDIKKLYKDVSQSVAQKNLDPSTGRIEVNAYQKVEDHNWKESSLEEVPKTIETLQMRGYQARDIAVLVRKGDEGKKVIEQLIRYKNSNEAKDTVCYDAVSNESLFLGNSSAIRIIINTIKYCLNPEDKIAFGEICFNYKYLQNTGAHEENDLFYILRGDQLPANFEQECANLIQLPVYEMIERIIQVFELGGPQHKGYLQAFQDLVLEYFSNEKKDISDFLEWWYDKGKLKSIQLPENINAIQIMTIHKSKGLEFKAVLIPFCDWKLDHEGNKDNFLWCKTTQNPYNEMGYLPVKYSSALATSYYAQEYFAEMIKAHIDNLNLLYVALTRAEQFLMINCPPPGKEMKTAGDLVLNGLEHILGGDIENFEISVVDDFEDRVKYNFGNEEIEIEKLEATNDAKGGRPYISLDWRDKITLRKKGGIFFSETGEKKKEKINYGLLVHEILASIRGQQEVGRAIDKYYVEGQISGEDKITITNQLNLIFSNEQVQSWFNTDWEVKTEAAIIIKDKYPKRPDRVLIHGKKAIIIDFKTGQEKSADKRQILSYRDTLHEMGFEHIETYLLYIVQNNIIRVA